MFGVCSRYVFDVFLRCSLRGFQRVFFVPLAQFAARFGALMGTFLVQFSDFLGKRPTCDPIEPARSDCVLGWSWEAHFHNFLLHFLGS